MQNAPRYLWLLVLVFATSFLFVVSCTEETSHVTKQTMDSSCLSCHTDNDALIALAKSDDSGGESSGEG